MKNINCADSDTPLVTIVTATYNLIKAGRMESFDALVNNLQSQSYKNIEHLIIDGASTDGTLDILKQYEKDGKITLYSEPDKGLYDAYNKGLARARGKYIAYMGSDDNYAGFDIIERMVRRITETDSDWLYGDAYYVNRDGVFLWCGNLGHLIFASSPCHQSTMFLTNALRAVGGFKFDIISADTLSMIALMLNDYKACYLNCIISIFDGTGCSSNADNYMNYNERWGNYLYELSKDKLSVTAADWASICGGSCYNKMTSLQISKIAIKLFYPEWIKALMNQDLLKLETVFISGNKKNINRYMKYPVSRLKLKKSFYKVIKILNRKKYKKKIKLINSVLKEKQK